MSLAWTNMSTQSLLAVLAFLVAIVVVDAFEISLPRGDSIGVSGALVAAVVVLFGLQVALAVGLLSVVLSQSARRLLGVGTSLGDELAVRAVAALAAGGSWWAASQLGIEGLGVVLVPAVYLLVELLGRQVLLAWRAKRSLRRLLLGNLSRQGLLFAAQLSASALTVLTYRSMGAWSLIPVAGLLLIMRQAYAMLLEIRETYLNTVSVLIEAAESQDPALAGHAERTATVARSIGAQYGMGSHDIERVNYGALLHDIGKIADVPTGGSTEGGSAAIVADAAFFSTVVPILEVLDGGGGQDASAREEDVVAGFIIALSSDIDDANRQSRDTDGLATRLSAHVPRRVKADVVSAALELGYSVPAID